MSDEVGCTGTHQEGARPKVMGESQKRWGGRDEDACFHGPLTLQPSTRICVAFRCCVSFFLLPQLQCNCCHVHCGPLETVETHLRDSCSYCFLATLIFEILKLRQVLSFYEVWQVSSIPPFYNYLLTFLIINYLHFIITSHFFRIHQQGYEKTN